MPGWPLPTFWTASAARMRTVSTARTSRAFHLGRRANGWASASDRVGVAAVVRVFVDFFAVVGLTAGGAFLSGSRARPLPA